MPAQEWYSWQWPSPGIPACYQYKSPRCRRLLSPISVFSLTLRMTDCQIFIHFLSSKLGMLCSCQFHVFYSLEKAIETKSLQRTKKNIATLWLFRVFFIPLHYPSILLILITFTLCRLKTETGGVARAPPMMQTTHLQLKGPRENPIMYFHLPLREIQAKRQEGLALNQCQSWAVGLLTPVPMFSLL